MKRFLSSAVAVVILLSCIGVFCFADTPDFTGYTAISTKADLDAIREEPSGKYYLTTDIVFTDSDFSEGGDFYNNGCGFEPIPEFSGILDGNGHSVKNLKISKTNKKCAFIIKNKGTVKDLGLEDVDITHIMKITSPSTVASYPSASAVLDSNEAGAVISGLTVTGKFSVKAYGGTDLDKYKPTVAGICFSNSGTIEGTTLALDFDVDSGYKLAGFAAYTYKDSTVSGCENRSSLAYATEAAGFVYSNGGTVINCVNSADLNAGTAGGVVCSNSGILSGCKNTAGITAITKAGGIAAQSYANIDRCSNSGKVTSEEYAGGIVAFSSNDSRAELCSNTGEISSAEAGGIAGSGSSISRCCNSGYIKTTYYGGGIAGTASKIDNCYNTALIHNVYPTSTDNIDIGGIAGSCFEIKNCYSIGSTRSAYTVRSGAIAGESGSRSENNFCLPYTVTHCEVGTVCTMSQLKVQNTFIGFDFNTVWDISKDGDYRFPVLRGVFQDTDVFKNAAPENKTEFSGGNGTAVYPYRISTVAHLKNVSKYLDSCFILEDRIVFGPYTTWTPIGTYDEAFTGHFDGNGMPISDMHLSVKTRESVCQGLFGVNKGTIGNLVLSTGNVDIYLETPLTGDASYMYVGSLVGHNRGGMIANVESTYRIDAYNFGGGVSYYIGGIVGKSTGGYITRCEYRATIDATTDTAQKPITAGGIVGISENTEITYCQNHASVLAKVDRNSVSGNNVNIGGIAGDTNKGEILLCKNSGKISATLIYPGTESEINAGGIVGRADMTPVRACDNTGGIESSTYNKSSLALEAFTGGIAGKVTDTDNYGINIYNCTNAGVIYSHSAEAADYQMTYLYTGGIVGKTTVKVEKCSNTANVSAMTNKSAHCSGIAGYASRDITDSFNHGDIKAHSFKSSAALYAAGIAAYIQNGKVERTYNIGDITVTSYAHTSMGAGIVADNPYTMPTRINNSFNAGNVSVTDAYISYAGGISGNCNYISNCYSVGEYHATVAALGSLYSGPILATYSPDVINCYHIDKYPSGMSVSCADEELRVPDTFVGFDFDNVWFFNASHGYPYPMLRPNLIVSEVTGITLTAPDKLVYYTNETEPVLDGGYVTVSYAIGTAVRLPVSKDMISGFSTSTLGRKTVTVSFGGKSESFTITVICSHDYKREFDATYHFDKCTLCKSVTNTVEHDFINDCDTDCSDCGVIRKTSHKFTAYVSDGNATADSDGTKTRRCTVCDHHETVTDVGSRLENTVVEIKDTSKIYGDVVAGRWYKNAVDYSYSHGFISGMSNTEFGIGTNITRGMFITILARIAGVDTGKAANNVSTRFNDVERGKYYTAAIKWASENKIVNGMSTVTFEPNLPIQRQQLCVMIVNFAKFTRTPVDGATVPIRFEDERLIAGWAKASVVTCQTAGIISGYDIGHSEYEFRPTNTATRAEAAQILYKFHSAFYSKRDINRH